MTPVRGTTPPSINRVTTERPAKAGRLYAAVFSISRNGEGERVPRKPQALWLDRHATRVDYASLQDVAGEAAAKRFPFPTTTPPAFTTSAQGRSALNWATANLRRSQ